MKLKSRGFTLIELLVAFGIVAVGAICVIVAISIWSGVSSWAGKVTDKVVQSCVPGQVVGCPLPEGKQGVQTCKVDGTGFSFCTDKIVSDPY